MHRPLARLGPQVLSVVAGIGLLAGLFGGCASSGDPFGPETDPVLPVTSVSPPDGAIGVSRDTLISIGFPLDLDPRTVSRSTVHLQIADLGEVTVSDRPEPRRRGVSARIVYESTARRILIMPDEPLAASTTYEVVLQDVRSTGNVLFNTLVSRFSTGANTFEAPQVVAITPLPDQTQVPNRTPVVLTFSKIMDQPSLLRALSVAPTVAGTVTFQVSTTRTTMTFTPGDPYPTGGQVTITVRADARDLAGVPLGRSFVSRFTVVPAPFIDPTRIEPFPDDVNVPRNTPITLVFSTVMNEQSVKDATTLVFGSTIIAQGQGTFSFQTVGTPPQTIATFQPANLLPAGTTIQIRVDSQARTSTGVPLSPPFFSRFTTGS